MLSGKVFRSDALDSLSVADCRRLADVTLVIDLRSSRERELSGPSRLEVAGVAVHHVPIIDETREGFDPAVPPVSISDMYRQMVDDSAERFVNAIRLLAEAHAPAVFHCAAGKDRTGLLAAFILDLLGVGDADIETDYALSERVVPTLLDRFRARATDPRYRRYQAETAAWERVATEMMSARPATIAGALEHIRSRHHNVARWALDHGLEAVDLVRLRGRLLSPA